MRPAATYATGCRFPSRAATRRSDQQPGPAPSGRPRPARPARPAPLPPKRRTCPGGHRHRRTHRRRKPHQRHQWSSRLAARPGTLGHTRRRQQAHQIQPGWWATHRTATRHQLEAPRYTNHRCPPTPRDPPRPEPHVDQRRTMTSKIGSSADKETGRPGGTPGGSGPGGTLLDAPDARLLGFRAGLRRFQAVGMIDRTGPDLTGPSIGHIPSECGLRESLL